MKNLSKWKILIKDIVNYFWVEINEKENSFSLSGLNLMEKINLIS